MSPHFCRVGKIKPDVSKFLNVSTLEKRIKNFVDDISKVEFSKDMNGAI